ncbi:MAG: SpoIIE family protein phosphatase [Bacillota bacterium]|jgi:hypothetical protein
MELFLEIGTAQLNKAGEELCGDTIETAGNSESKIVVLADGLGSGVKANILSGLTSKIAAKMLEGGCSIDEVIEALAQALPVCEVRGLAYSTFSISQVMPDGSLYLAEYDNPPAVIIKNDAIQSVAKQSREVANRKINEAHLRLHEGDWVVLVSDGVLHAGIGGLWNLGWGWDRIAEYTRSLAATDISAQELAEGLVAVCDKLYNSKPGDDTSVVALRFRQRRELTVMVGPPADRDCDARVVRDFLSSPGKKAVCGGTTGNIVARETGEQLSVDLSSMDPRIPPVGNLVGIDLVCEGILTLTYTLERLKEESAAGTVSSAILPRKLKWKRDGVSRLLSALLEADEIRFMVGRALNPAHQSSEMPADLALKHRVIEDIAALLEKMGKRVSVSYT